MKELGQNFLSESDTEVLLAAWHTWGVTCLKRLVGMFAFVIYDRQANTLTAVRDAFGIKPLFYTINKEQFLFASEIQALQKLINRKLQLDWQRSYDYLMFGDYDSCEQTFFQDIRHLLPGHFLRFNIASREFSTPQAWWQPNIEQRSFQNFPDAADELRQLFLNSIRLHLRSDVPLGAALSGGIDSSAVVCAIRHLEPDLPVHTFSYVARNSRVSEEHWVDKINSHVGAKAHKVFVSPAEIAADLDDIIQIQGEPFGDTSIYAQYRVLRLARESGMIVTLDGQGADEMLAGYHGYPAYRMRSLLEQGRIPELIKFVHNWKKWPGRTGQYPWKVLVGQLLPDHLFENISRLIGINRMPAWLDGNILKEAGIATGLKKNITNKIGAGRRVIEVLAKSLTIKGLPSMLRHLDRNAMRFSIESRVPFLTIPMAEFLLALPEEYLISHQGETKSIFRKAMRGIVPDEILRRKDKIGFATPEKSWLRFLSDTIMSSLRVTNSVPFLKMDVLLYEYKKTITGHKYFTTEAWRWINFCRWFQVYQEQIKVNGT